MFNISATSVDIMDSITISPISADKLKPHFVTTTEFIYNIAERLIEELDAEAKHMRSLGLFG